MIDIKSMTEADLSKWLGGFNVAPYRTGQIFRWIYHRHVTSFSQMTDLPKALREFLSEHMIITQVSIDRIQTSSDGSKKYLLRLRDGQHIESVLIPERNHWTLCISTQVGCAMGCKFCLTGQNGFVRNLRASEIVNQVLTIIQDFDSHERLTNIVLMGMGEPLANYDNVLKALRIITSNNGLGFSSRRVTLSTAGLVPEIQRLGRDINVNLAVSLNASEDNTRSYLMPVNRTYSLKEVIDACKRFPLPPRRRITFEYVMLAGINDSLRDAERLSRLLRPVRSKINLIPFNQFDGSKFKRPDDSVILSFQKYLIDRKYTAIVRKSKGSDISAACGQLRARMG
nr:23S rRNA (adenine(2503)-C(2))-methyltransferase RlmN [Desulfobacterales bacterium]